MLPFLLPPPHNPPHSTDSRRTRRINVTVFVPISVKLSWCGVEDVMVSCWEVIVAVGWSARWGKREGEGKQKRESEKESRGWSNYCMVVSNFNTVVSRKYAPPFATLALVQTQGGAYTRDATISLMIIPSNKAWDATGRLTSFSVEERESRALPRSSWCVHCWCRLSVFAVNTLTVDSKVA